MTLGRTSSGAIKIKTDSAGGGLRAVSCACCGGSDCIKPTPELKQILETWTSLQVSFTWPAIDYLLRPEISGNFNIPNTPESLEYFEYVTTYTREFSDDSGVYEVTNEERYVARTFVTDEGFVFFNLQELSTGSSVDLNCGILEEYYRDPPLVPVSVLLNGRNYPAYSLLLYEEDLPPTVSLTFS